MILALRRPSAQLSERPRRRELSGGTHARAFERARRQGVRWRGGAWLLSAIVAVTHSLGEAGAGDKHEDSVVGGVETYEARFDDTILDVARRFGMGIEEMKLANPGIDLWLPGEGTAIRLPSRFVLPSGPRRGIVINVPEMRLYHYPKDGTQVRTWPVGIGRLEYETPIGRTSVTRKKVGPVWYPTDAIREEYAARGEDLPKVVLPGPDNPLGSYAIYLGHAIEGVKWPQNGQVENVPFAGRRRVCTEALGREEDVNSMISRRRCVEEDRTFVPAANQHVLTVDGRGRFLQLARRRRTRRSGIGQETRNHVSMPETECSSMWQ